MEHLFCLLCQPQVFRIEVRVQLGLLHQQNPLILQQMIKEEQLEQSNLRQQQIIEHRKYGNLIVISQKYFHISVGPQYRFLLMGIGMMLFFQIAMLLLVAYNIESENHKKFGYLMSIVTPLLYILTAMMDPGRYNPEKCYDSKTRYCHFCQHYTPNNIRHCHKCNICLVGYDHHCPWIAKCVAKNNLIPFYLFILSMAAFNTYMYYTFYLIFWGSHS